MTDIISRLLCDQQFLTDEEDIHITKIQVAIDQLEEIGEPVVPGATLRTQTESHTFSTLKREFTLIPRLQ